MKEKSQTPVVMCKTCPYWVVGAGGFEGECRLAPPQIQVLPVQTLADARPQLGINSFFPKIRWNLWCGLHPDFDKQNPPGKEDDKSN